MNVITRYLIILVGLALGALVACAPDVTPSDGGTSTISSPSTSTSQLSPTAAPNSTEATRAAFAATSKAVSAYLATQGVPPDKLGQYSQATLQALGILPVSTQQPTATPFPVPFPVSTSVDQHGVTHYEFIDPNDVRSARQAYERYIDFISFRNGPPSANLKEELVQYLSPDADATDASSECGYIGVLNKIMGLAQQGRYLRLSLPEGIKWNDNGISLFVSPGDMEAVMDLESTPLVVEQVETKTGKVVKQSNMNLVSTARMDYDWTSGQWVLTLDQRGFYCQGIN